MLPKLSKKKIDHTFEKMQDTLDEIRDSAEVNEETQSKICQLVQDNMRLTTQLHRSTVQMQATQQQMEESQKQLFDLTSTLHSAIIDSTNKK